MEANAKVLEVEVDPCCTNGSGFKDCTFLKSCGVHNVTVKKDESK